MIGIKTRTELERIVYHSLKYAFKKEIVETGLEKTLFGIGKKYRSKIDWELEQMQKWNKYITCGRF